MTRYLTGSRFFLLEIWPRHSPISELGNKSEAVLSGSAAGFLGPASPFGERAVATSSVRDQAMDSIGPNGRPVLVHRISGSPRIPDRSRRPADSNAAPAPDLIPAETEKQSRSYIRIGTANRGSPLIDTGTVSMKGFTPSACRRFCSGRTICVQSSSIRLGSADATHSTTITCGLQNSIEFNSN
jgi:hypothetical protein